MSAASVINALGSGKYDIILIGITKRGEWKLFEGDADSIESGEWEKKATPFVIDSLKKEIDFAFPVLHGPYGEDGTIQGLFEILDIPYAGCGVLASSLAMDKIAAKEIFSLKGLPVCKYIMAMAEEIAGKSDIAAVKIEEYFSGKYPLFTKPANMGSSVGISKVKCKDDIADALFVAAKYDRRIIIEEGIDGREFETAILGNTAVSAAVVGEIMPSAEFYDYHSKYLDGGKSRVTAPADIPHELSERIRTIAVKAYEALDCAGFARVDFLADRHTGEVYLSELNTIPGFTKYSMFPLLWQASGVVYAELLERIVDLGYERYHAKNNRQTTER
jgi:D-alanine-D-alanine ligase